MTDNPLTSQPIFFTQESRGEEQTGLLPLSLLKSGQFLAIPPQCKGGLIVQKRFYADLVVPGAAVGGVFDLNSTLIYPIGDISFYAPTTYEERRQAFQSRMGCNSKLQAIVSESAPLARACRIIHLLSRWLGPEEAGKIPVDLIARLVGVLPKTVETAWVAYRNKAVQTQTEVVAV